MGDSLIKALGETVDDIESARIANGNRIFASKEEHGDVLPELIVIQEQLVKVEKAAIKQLEQAVKGHPLNEWADGIKGLGRKSLGRLLAEVGDPASRPNPAKFWQYCGHGNPHLKRRKGMTREQAMALGNPGAKKRVWLIATQFVKTVDSPYRPVYDAGRARYADRDWTDGHKHAAAIRLVGKAFLLDLWKESRKVANEE